MIYVQILAVLIALIAWASIGFALRPNWRLSDLQQKGFKEGRRAARQASYLDLKDLVDDKEAAEGHAENLAIENLSLKKDLEECQQVVKGIVP